MSGYYSTADIVKSGRLKLKFQSQFSNNLLYFPNSVTLRFSQQAKIFTFKISLHCIIILSSLCQNKWSENCMTLKYEFKSFVFDNLCSTFVSTNCTVTLKVSTVTDENNE